MRTTYHKTRRWLWTLFALLPLLLTACGSANANATPTMSVDDIFTLAAQTITAEQATQLALTPPTSTPSPTLVPTLAPPPSPVATFSFATPVPITGGGGCDSAVYVSDVTIPDGTTIAPGQTFVKKWSLLNNGTCTWSTSYGLAFSSGDLMGGTTSPVTVPVAPGSQSVMAVNLTAPTTNGTYTGTWRMQNASGQAFGNFITVVIKVGAGSTSTAGPSPTAGTPGMVTISGSWNVGQVTLNFSNASSTPTVTYTSGGYSFVVHSGWSGTISPSKGNPGHWVFTPASQTFNNVTSNQTQDFTAVPVTPTASATP